jgi:hypothetical protein
MLSFDAAGFQRQLENAAREIERAVEEAGEAAVEAVGQHGLELKKAEVEKTYERAEPRGSHRTGALRSGQHLEGERGERRIGPGTVYEEHLAHLRPGADGVDRSNPAAANAQAQIEAEAQAIAERAIEDSLRRTLGT